MKLALKIDVDSFRAMREGVPALLQCLERHDAGATFFFCVGPDYSRRARIWPGGALGRRFGEAMRAVRATGFETGVQAYDAVHWRKSVASANAAWTAAELQRAVDRYADLFGEPPRAHASAGWQTNIHALRLTQRLRFDYCSDGRGSFPHLPVHNAELIRCPQFPTTLPTLDELLAESGVTRDNVAAHFLALTENRWPDPQVFTVHADAEGLSRLHTFEQLVVGLKAQGYALVSLRALYDAVEPLALPRCEVAMQPLVRNARPLLVQGEEFLGSIEVPEAA